MVYSEVCVCVCVCAGVCRCAGVLMGGGSLAQKMWGAKQLDRRAAGEDGLAQALLLPALAHSTPV